MHTNQRSVRQPPQEGITLLGVIEVSREDRVLCQGPDCGHSVYREIYVTLDRAGRLGVLGRVCFGKLRGEATVQLPLANACHGDGQPLTDEEHRHLLENTNRLIARLESDRQAKIQAAAAADATFLAWLETQAFRARRYSKGVVFKNGDIVDHDTLGRGLVQAIRAGGKLEVRFASGIRLLVHGQS